MTRDEACERFRRRIVLLARRVHERAAPPCPVLPEDLFACGVLGLLEAFDRYDPAHGVEFGSFASYRILGEMLDAIRAASGSTRRQRKLCRDLEKAASRARERLGRDPGHLDVAAELGVDAEGYWRFLGTIAPPDFVPLDGETSLPPEEPAAPRRLLVADAHASLRDAIARLPERQRDVVLLYYAQDRSLAEIGHTLAVTPSRVCQILTEARIRLRKVIGEEIDPGLFAAGP
ncbi:MAG: sigma-70 family RNA polymerase sigma factor [Myxococcota bacterium]